MITRKFYLHSSKEYMWDEGERMGLEGEALKMFMYALYEVELLLEVDERTGEYRILEVSDGNSTLR